MGVKAWEKHLTLYRSITTNIKANSCDLIKLFVLSFSWILGHCPSGKDSNFCPNSGLSAHPLSLPHDSLSGWHCVLIATVHSSDAGLVVMAQPFLLWMFFCLKWQGTLTLSLSVLGFLFAVLGGEQRAGVLHLRGYIWFWGIWGCFQL